MRMPGQRLLLGLLAAAVSGCNCGGSGLQQQEPSISVNPSLLDFSTQTIGVLHTGNVTVSNQGDGTLQMSAAIMTGSSVFSIVSSPSTIVSGDMASIVVGYDPTGAGPDQGTLVITSNDPKASTVNVLLKGGPNPTCDGGVCAPGTMRTVGCDVCGSEVDTCSSACQWTLGMCNLPEGGCNDGGSPDAGRDAGAMDAGTPDSGVPDSGTPDSGTPDSGTDSGCDPDGLYFTTPTVSYICCNDPTLGPAVDISITQLTFSTTGPTLTVTPGTQWSPAGNPTGAATTCPTGGFSAKVDVNGGCEEIYVFDGGFTSPTTWSGTVTMQYIDHDGSCSCFSGALGSPPCTDQGPFDITATHQ